MKNIYEIRANPDIILPIRISFAESCFGKHHTRIKYKRYDKCPDCNWFTGMFGLPKCEKCHGTGLVSGINTVVADIPAGIEDGMKLRLPGMGNLISGNTRGDLILEISVKPDSVLRREGSDIICEKEVTEVTAKCGGVINVDSADGTIALQIPPNTKDGQCFRAKGRGAYKLAKKERGDFYIRIKYI